MRQYSTRELKKAVVLAVILTAIATMAVLDPSCRQTITDKGRWAPFHTPGRTP